MKVKLILSVLSVLILSGCYTKKVEKTESPSREVVVHEHDDRPVVRENRSVTVE